MEDIPFAKISACCLRLFYRAGKIKNPTRMEKLKMEKKHMELLYKFQDIVNEINRQYAENESFHLLINELQKRQNIFGCTLNEINIPLFLQENSYTTIKNDSNEHQILKVFVIQDNLYFSYEEAEMINEWKEPIREGYIILKPQEELMGGQQALHYRYETRERAMEDLAEELNQEGS